MKYLFLTFIFLIINFSYQRDLQSTSFVTCSENGDCQRGDKVTLQLGWVPKIPQKNFQAIFSTTNSRPTTSINPFFNSTSLEFIKGSSSYVCADGVYECFNSCCNQGYCSDPSNVCTSAMKSSAATVYASCIMFSALAVFYWIYFGYLGAKYAKNKSNVRVITDEKPSKDKNEEFLDRNKSGAHKGLNNFDDEYNTNRYIESMKNNKSEISGIGGFIPKDVEMKEYVLTEKASKAEITEKQREVKNPLDSANAVFPKKRSLIKSNADNENEQEKKSHLEAKAGKLQDLFYKEKSDTQEIEDNFEIKEL